jgi:hypothetical protein
VTQSTDHIDDEALSALVDNQLTPDEAAHVHAHMDSCAACQERSQAVRSVAELLRGLPDVEPPRDFQLGPRVLRDPPNVIRLRRWYTATRVAAASLAAVFVFLSVGTLYVDSRPAVAPAVSTAADATQPQVLSAPAGAPQNAEPAAQSAPKPAAAAVAARQSSPVPAAGVAAAARPAQAPESDDQVAAATSVNPLPTPVPTPVPLARSIPVPAAQPAAPIDTAAPWRNSAAVAGVLAVLALLAALVARHRLQRLA